MDLCLAVSLAREDVVQIIDSDRLEHLAGDHETDDSAANLSDILEIDCSLTRQYDASPFALGWEFMREGDILFAVG